MFSSSSSSTRFFTATVRSSFPLIIILVIIIVSSSSSSSCIFFTSASSTSTACPGDTACECLDPSLDPFSGKKFTRTVIGTKTGFVVGTSPYVADLSSVSKAAIHFYARKSSSSSSSPIAQHLGFPSFIVEFVCNQYSVSSSSVPSAQFPGSAGEGNIFGVSSQSLVSYQASTSFPDLPSSLSVIGFTFVGIRANNVAPATSSILPFSPWFVLRVSNCEYSLINQYPENVPHLSECRDLIQNFPRNVLTTMNLTGFMLYDLPSSQIQTTYNVELKQPGRAIDDDFFEGQEKAAGETTYTKCITLRFRFRNIPASLSHQFSQLPKDFFSSRVLKNNDDFVVTAGRTRSSCLGSFERDPTDDSGSSVDDQEPLLPTWGIILIVVAILILAGSVAAIVIFQISCFSICDPDSDEKTKKSFEFSTYKEEVLDGDGGKREAAAAIQMHGIGGRDRNKKKKNQQQKNSNNSKKRMTSSKNNDPDDLSEELLSSNSDHRQASSSSPPRSLRELNQQALLAALKPSAQSSNNYDEDFDEDDDNNNYYLGARTTSSSSKNKAPTPMKKKSREQQEQEDDDEDLDRRIREKKNRTLVVSNPDRLVDSTSSSPLIVELPPMLRSLSAEQQRQIVMDAIARSSSSRNSSRRSSFGNGNNNSNTDSLNQTPTKYRIRIQGGSTPSFDDFSDNNNNNNSNSRSGSTSDLLHSSNTYSHYDSKNCNHQNKKPKRDDSFDEFINISTNNSGRQSLRNSRSNSAMGRSSSSNPNTPRHKVVQFLDLDEEDEETGGTKNIDFEDGDERKVIHQHQSKNVGRSSNPLSPVLSAPTFSSSSLSSPLFASASTSSDRSLRNVSRYDNL